MKKYILLALAFCSILFARDILVRVDLTEERLTPLFDLNLKIIVECEHCAVVLLDDQELEKITHFTYYILDTEPEEGAYYMVRLLADINLEQYGQILTRDGADYIIKLQEGMLEELIRNKVMLKRLLLDKPIIRSSGAVPRPVFNEPLVQMIVDDVDPDSVLSHVQRLQDFKTRVSTHDSCFAAAQYIADKFTAYGCDSVYFQNHTSGHAPNVVGIKRGVFYPDNVYAVVCGHFDAITYQIWKPAPGADDNASGTTSAIEAARVMQDRSFEYAIRFIAFSGEEYGLYGSEYYAAQARAADDSILAVFNADMIAYSDVQPEELEVIAKISNPACEPLADFFIAAADTYTTLHTRKQMVNSMGSSDHAPFWDNGYIALCCIEDYMPVNPHYHTSHDTIGAGYNDNAFCTEAIKAHVAALALTAVPYGEIIGIKDALKGAAEKTTMSVFPTVGRSLFTIKWKPGTLLQGAAVTIYDAAGQRVKTFTIASENTSQILWSGDDDSEMLVPAGVYFVTCNTRAVQQTAKVTVVR